MASFGSYVKQGAGFSGGMALWGVLVLIGLALMILSKNAHPEKKSSMFWIGLVLVIIGGLPYLPLFGLQYALDQLTN